MTADLGTPRQASERPAPFCRSSSFVHTRRALAPSHCLSRTGRRKRRGPGGAGDEDIGDGGNDGGAGGGEGGGGEDGDPWYGDEGPQGRAGSGLLWLWQALCLCSFLQVRFTVRCSLGPCSHGHRQSDLMSGRPMSDMPWEPS